MIAKRFCFMIESSKHPVSRSTQKKTIQTATAFVAGVLTLGVEIIVGRILAPFFGSSLHQWAALIGIVLLAYMVGYATYSKIVSRGLFVPLALGGLYVLSLPLWIHGGVSLFIEWPLPVASVLGALLAVGLPSVLWASILPEIQRQVGPAHSARVLAWSSAGNLAGAWGVAFLAVPFLGTRLSLIALGVASLVLGSLWWKSSPKAIAILLAILGLGGLATSVQGGIRRAVEPWDAVISREHGAAATSHERISVQDSAYQNIAVWDETTGGVVRRALTLNGSLQFLWQPDGSEKLTNGQRYEYYNFSTAAAAWTAEVPAKEILVLGLGGGLVPWQIQQFFPESKITSYELDKGVHAMAAAHLPLAKSHGIDVRIGDGRQLLRLNDRKFDYILLDTFLNSYVPFHLTTKEFFDLARDRLKPGGVLVANFHTVFRTSGLLPKLEATIRSSFPSVGALDLPAGTTLIVASPDADVVLVERLRKVLDSNPPGLRELTERAANGLRAVAEPTPDLILTDDLNDTEQRLYETRRYILIARPL